MVQELEYSLLSAKDGDDMVKFVRKNFFDREPLGLGLGMTWEDHIWVEDSIKSDWVTSGASYVCRDKANENKIVGCRLSVFLDKKKAGTFNAAKTSPNKKVQLLSGIFEYMKKQKDIFEDPKVDKALEFAMLSVCKEYGGQGIAKKLVQLSEERGKELGAKLAIVIASNIRTQKIFGHFGYETVFTLDYESYEVDGKKVLDLTKMEDSKCAMLMTKML